MTFLAGGHAGKGLVRETDRLQTRYAELTREFPATMTWSNK